MNDIDVKEIRGKSGLTQEELAERMGVSPRTVQNWEAGGVISTTYVDILYIIRAMYQIGDFLGA